MLLYRCWYRVTRGSVRMIPTLTKCRSEPKYSLEIVGNYDLVLITLSLAARYTSEWPPASSAEIALGPTSLGYLTARISHSNRTPSWGKIGQEQGVPRASNK